MSQHTFSPPADGSMSPKAWYQAMSDKPGFIRDPSQAAAIADLDALWHELVDFKTRRNHFLGRSLLSPDVPKGIYFWGGVGRGKSFLMDVFYACVPYKRKRRIHFHNFMAEVHHEMKLLATTKDPLLALADNIAKSTRLLCFDEFHVSDIADAMILGRLMAALFERGVVMLITSNYSPDDLYPNGLQRQKFLPAIGLIKQNLRVINIDSGNDYRLREMASAPLFMLASDPESKPRMQAFFQRLGAGTVQNTQQIEIQGRAIEVVKLAANVVWFDFNAICGGPRAQADYLEIAHKFSVVLVSDIPLLTASHAAEIQRFIWLVDVLYDNRVKLVATAEKSPSELCSGAEHAMEFARTASRLTEMQSQNYLELQHQSESVTLNP
ncbi:MAG: cell division protein ZapE [Gallionellaceae bacterium]|jgi:cell division protein ZapE